VKPTFWDYAVVFLLPIVIVFAITSLVLWATSAPAAMVDCISATCRVTSVEGDKVTGVGTGCVFEISNGNVFVLTNAHVADRDRMKVEFWEDGHLSRPLYGSTVMRSVSRDIAVISIDAAVFGQSLPNVIPIAPLNTQLHIGQTITSVGCANSAWATAFKGHIRNPVDDVGGLIAFDPTPALGRSGSAIFDEDGKHIVALLRAQRLEYKDGPPIYGLAVSIRDIWASLYGDMVDTGRTIKDRETFWPPAIQEQVPVQCGPRGCPTPGGSGQRVLPYRQRQDDIDRRQDRRIDDLYPTKPFEVPKLEVEPPADGGNVHESAPPPPVVKERGPPIGFIVGFLLLAAGVGMVLGLAVQWKATYPKL